ncbi:MAG: hypothetical protein O7A63_09730, partial [Acidobacteria bacterium]|nr:hypothetical protein [Acidobacteriota bacterium]
MSSICFTDEQVLALASGETDAREAETSRGHLAACEKCRTRFEEEHESLKKALRLLAIDQDLLSPDPAALESRVLAGVARYQRNPELFPSSRSGTFRFRRLAAAAVILLAVAVGARFLGESKWQGHLEDSQGVLLVSRADGVLVTLDDPAMAIEPGCLIQLTPGASTRLVIDDVGVIALSKSALVAFGSSPDGPLYVGRGEVEVSRTGDRPLRIEAGKLSFEVEGAARFAVTPVSAVLARQWVEDRSDSSSGLVGIFQNAWANGPSVLAARVQVQALRSSIRVLNGRSDTLPQGWEVTYSPDTRRSTAVAASRKRSLLRDPPLSPEELDIARDMFRTRGPAWANLYDVAIDPGTSAWQRGLAIWFIGELTLVGVEDRLDTLPRDESLPMVVRSATIRTLFLLGRREAGRAALTLSENPPAALVEAWVYAEARHGSLDTLAPFVENEEQYDFSRALASLILQSKKIEVPLASLIELCGSADRDAADLATRLLASRTDPEAVAELLGMLKECDDQSRATLFRIMARKKVKGALQAARAALNSDVDALRAAAIYYIHRLDKTLAKSLLPDLLSTGPGGAREEALRSALRLKNGLE